MKKIDKLKKKDAGFTLVEVMVTMVIIGLMTTFVVVNVLPARGKAQVQKARTDINTFEQAIEMYRLDMNSYPESLEALVEISGDDARFRSEGYIKFLRDDPWDNPYLYAYPGDNGAVDIWTYGADGVEGGEGLNADIGNWQR